jgi:hypothetical protein
MSERLKVFLIIAMFGFVAGVIADLTAEYVIPALINILPTFLQARTLLSGIAGALLTVALVSVWAYITGTQEF